MKFKNSHFLSAKQSYTAQRGQCGHILQAVRGSLLCIDFLLSKMKTLPLYLDCRAGALCSSPHTPEPPSSAQQGSAPQVLPSCYVLPQRNQGKENGAQLGFFLTWGQHVPSAYCTAHGTDITVSAPCTVVVSLVALEGFRLLLMQLCYLKKDEYAPSICMLCLPSISGPWQTCVAGVSSCSAEPTIPTVKSEISSYSLWSVPYACTEAYIYIPCPPVPSFPGSCTTSV